MTTKPIVVKVFKHICNCVLNQSIRNNNLKTKQRFSETFH